MDSFANGTAVKECDLVMKGGITSGIVYPGAVQELHAAGYRFRSIGGTSAGAIAAGLTAAAQCGGEQGFARLKEVSEQLATEGFLLHLFQPSTPEAQTLFRLVNAVASARSMPDRARAVLDQLGTAPKPQLQGALLGAAGGALPALLVTAVGSLFGLEPRSGLLAAVAGGLVGGAAGYLAGKAVASVEALPRLVQRALSEENAFGLCYGHAPNAPASRSGQLSDWLGWAIDYVAGKTDADEVSPTTQPLTMRDLRAQGIDFRAMTSNLSEGQPYPLPFAKKNFLFREEDARRFFPAHVAEYLISHAYRGDQEDTGTPRALTPGYHFLPYDDDFPVLLAVRMSLSFPVLISALPLYKLTSSGWAKLKRGEAPDPLQDFRRHWFSDGGLSSNFPIHFFDAWVPHRPTFGINLVGVPSGTEPPSPKLQEPNPPNEADTWTEVAGLAPFFNAIWSTAQNYRDNMQSQLPSYRERIVPVGLSASEGGLNLKMAPEVVNAVMNRGAAAGKALADFDMDHHLWVRYLVLMKVLEENLAEFRSAVGSNGESFKSLAERQLAARETGQKFPYHRDAVWCQEAAQRIEQLEKALQDIERLHFENGCPRPPSVLRVTPDA